MAERSGFFPYVEGDANSEYNSAFLAKLIASFIGSGVYDGDLVVAAGENMQIKIPAGQAWINGYFYRNDGDMVFDIANADGVLNRKDTVVLRWDINNRAIGLQVLEGTPASTAIAPEISRTAEQYDLKLAEISIPAGTTAITQALITDTRLDDAVCGIVTGVIRQVDTTKLYQQIQSDLANFKSGSEADFTSWSTAQKQSFQTWLDGIKGILGKDEAANLLAKINDLAGDDRTTETVKANADAIAAHTSDTDLHVTAAQKEAWTGKADHSTVTTATLSTSDWTGSDAPYSQTIDVTGAKPEPVRIEVQPSSNATAEQWEAWRAALIRGGGQDTGTITLLADGDKPEVDIPITVTVRGDVS